MTRYRKGTKLTWEKVAEIRRLYFDQGWTQPRLARQYGMGVAQIGKIVRGEAWVEAPGQTEAPLDETPVTDGLIASSMERLGALVEEQTLAERLMVEAQKLRQETNADALLEDLARQGEIEK